MAALQSMLKVEKEPFQEMMVHIVHKGLEAFLETNEPMWILQLVLDYIELGLCGWFSIY